MHGPLIKIYKERSQAKQQKKKKKRGAKRGTRREGEAGAASQSLPTTDRAPSYIFRSWVGAESRIDILDSLPPCVSLLSSSVWTQANRAKHKEERQAVSLSQVSLSPGKGKVSFCLSV